MNRVTRPKVYCWNVTDQEVEMPYPIDADVPVPSHVFFRGITIQAPDWVVWRWLGQLRVAPYSYDFIDNRGRRSPRQLLELPPIRVGDTALIGYVNRVEEKSYVSGIIREDSKWRALFREFGATYRIIPKGPESCRLVVKLNAVFQPGFARRLLALAVMTVGDLVMMMKQLRTIKELAEKHYSTLREINDTTR